VLALLAMSGHGLRIGLSEQVRLSFTSWPRLVAWAAGLLVLRHSLWRRIPWHMRARDRISRMLSAEAFRAVWPSFLVSRISVLLVG
ncbi:hypothetical protein, partial [Klebsiella pneumoniae]|uniref:hypothetical protein n=1 Tax=Klebsiella pneumoniae TaxID=573 RepID=UPI0025A0764C